ncbi:MAG: hypothetical protein ACFE96_09005 [Candidatus Hermodarchaeota archaeon]
MAILDQNVHPQITELNEYSKVKITCPVCKAIKELSFPKSVINEANQLTTISIPKGLLCDHHFQAFVDKNFAVRGYQKVDFEYETQKSLEPKTHVKNDDDLFENLILEGNYVEYKPSRETNRDSHPPSENGDKSNGQRSLKDIYEEFWEFIDDKNLKFQEFIEKDKRRVNLRFRLN